MLVRVGVVRGKARAWAASGAAAGAAHGGVAEVGRLGGHGRRLELELHGSEFLQLALPHGLLCDYWGWGSVGVVVWVGGAAMARGGRRRHPPWIKP